MLFLKFLNILGPFLLECYGRDSEDGSNKKVSFRIKVITLIGLLAILGALSFDGIMNLLYETNIQYRNLSKEYTVLENNYRRVINERSALQEDLDEIGRHLARMERDIGRVKATKDFLEKENSELRIELDLLGSPNNVNGATNISNIECIIPTPPRSRVLEYLNGL